MLILLAFLWKNLKISTENKIKPSGSENLGGLLNQAKNET